MLVLLGGCSFHACAEKVQAISPPVASFTTNVTSGVAPLTVQFIDASTGDNLTYLWRFGDGGSSVNKNPVFTYTLAGTYVVNLTVSNAAGSASAEQSIQVNPAVTTQPTITTIPTTTIIPTGTPTSIPPTEPPAPPFADFSANRTAGPLPCEVLFSDLSTGTGINDWNWDFGDGNTSVLQNPSHTYRMSGNFTVRLRVNSTGGTDWENKSSYIQVTLIPEEVDFTANKTSGDPPVSIQFTDLSAGSPDAWFWDFGDGATSTLQNPVHTYTEAGTYSVHLMVKDNTTARWENKTAYIVAGTISEEADFSMDNYYGFAPLTVYFTDISTAENITRWFWDFGDGGTSSTRNPVYTYREPGTYSVTLSITSSKGISNITKWYGVVVNMNWWTGIREEERTFLPWSPSIPVLPLPTVPSDVNITPATFSLPEGAETITRQIPIPWVIDRQNQGTFILVDRQNAMANNFSVEVQEGIISLSGNDFRLDITADQIDENETVISGMVQNITCRGGPFSSHLSVGNVSVSYHVGLSDLPALVVYNTTFSDQLPNSVREILWQSAEKEKYSVKEIAYLVNYDTGSLPIAPPAMVRMGISPSWVDTQRDPAQIHIFRISDRGRASLLETKSLGIENNLVIFEGHSPEGMSTFLLGSFIPISEISKPTVSPTMQEAETQMGLPVPSGEDPFKQVTALILAYKEIVIGIVVVILVAIGWEMKKRRERPSWWYME